LVAHFADSKIYKKALQYFQLGRTIYGQNEEGLYLSSLNKNYLYEALNVLSEIKDLHKDT
jgi:hypothetical protein